MIQSGTQLPMFQGPERTASGIAIASATAAVACAVLSGVCCVLPFALPAVVSFAVAGEHARLPILVERDHVERLNAAPRHFHSR